MEMEHFQVLQKTKNDERCRPPWRSTLMVLSPGQWLVIAVSMTMDFIVLTGCICEE
jgi:hypothetical protein